MLNYQVRECLRHAEDCMQQAAIQTNPKLRRDYLIIAARWLKLVRELSELPANFSNIETEGLAALPGERRSEVHSTGVQA